MNSFRLTVVGQLARNPELSIKGAITFARFCLVGDDEVSDGEEDGPREVVTSLWFFAFGEIASTIAHNAEKGHHLFLEAGGVGSSWRGKGGERRYGYSDRLCLRG